MFSRIFRILTVAIIFAGITTAVHAQSSINTSGLSHGALIDDELLFTQGVFVGAHNAQNSNVHAAQIFNSDYAGATSDTDLQRFGGWSGGNFAGSVGNLFIVPENLTNNPDDNERGGNISFRFDGPQAFNSFDFRVVDWDGSYEHLSVGFSSGGQQTLVSIDQFLDQNSAYYDPSIQLGDRSANHIHLSPQLLASLGLRSFDGFWFQLSGSGGIGDISWGNATVPEPATMILFGSGMMAFAARRRRVTA